MSATIPMASSTATTIIPSTSTDKPVTQEQHFQPSDFSFLAQLLGLLSRTEAGGIDNQELASMAGNLKNSFKKCQTILDHLPGADLSPDEQERVLAEELQILERKKAQLAEYLSWQVFDHTVPDTTTTEPSEITSGDTATGTPLDAPLDITFETADEALIEAANEAASEAANETADEIANEAVSEAANETANEIANETADGIQVKLEDTEGSSTSLSSTASPSVDMSSPPQGALAPSQLRSEISSDLADISMKDSGSPL
ncbi:hypothetical protein CPC16_009945 [Podila verticillata]|nr:hypothetical protein CPC16_009945 [Podila verticillata]